MFIVRGSFDRLMTFLKRMKNGDAWAALEGYGEEGVRALQAFTPVDSGITANSWYYEIKDAGGYFKIEWANSSTNQGYNIAILVQYGHGTGTGGYVVGRDYINPALQPVFDKIADKVWKAVTSA